MNKGQRVGFGRGIRSFNRQLTQQPTTVGSGSSASTSKTCEMAHPLGGEISGCYSAFLVGAQLVESSVIGQGVVYRYTSNGSAAEVGIEIYSDVGFAKKYAGSLRVLNRNSKASLKRLIHEMELTTTFTGTSSVVYCLVFEACDMKLESYLKDLCSPLITDPLIPGREFTSFVRSMMETVAWLLSKHQGNQ